MTDVPTKQGHLDGLCGLYAIINAMDLADAKLTRKDRSKIFNHMLSVADHEWGLAEIMKQGTTCKQLRRLLRAANLVLLERKGCFLMSKLPFNKKESLDDIWQGLIDALECGVIPLIGTTKSPDHWTVVSEVTRNRLTVFDSDDRKVFNKANCAVPTTAKSEREGKTIIDPKEVFLLELKKLSGDES